MASVPESQVINAGYCFAGFDYDEAANDADDLTENESETLAGIGNVITFQTVGTAKEKLWLFLSRVLPSTGAYQFSRQIPEFRSLSENGAESIESLVAGILSSDKKHTDNNIYFCTAALGPQTRNILHYRDGKPVAGSVKRTVPARRGKSAPEGSNVSGKKCLQVDIDVGKPTVDSYDTTEEARQAVEEAIQRLGIGRPIIVSSGMGFHLYWTLSEPVSEETWSPVADKLKRALESHGFRVDGQCITDSVRVLRPIGTHWRKKGDERIVDVVDWGGGDESLEWYHARLEKLVGGTNEDTSRGGRDLLAKDAHDLTQNQAMQGRGPFSISRNRTALKSALYELDPNTENDWWSAMKVTKGAMELPEASNDEKAWFWNMVMEWSRQSPDFEDEDQQREKMNRSRAEHPRTIFNQAKEKNPDWVNPGEDRLDVAVGAWSATGGAVDEILTRVKTWDAHRSDTLTSEIFVESFGDRLKYVLASETWLFWDGGCWTASNRGEVTELAKRIGTAIFDDYGRRRSLEAQKAEQNGAADPDKEATKATIPWMALSKRACAEKGIQSMLRLAQSHPAVATASFAEFNADPFLLNVGNGILDLKTGVLGPHDPRAMMSQITRVNYNPEAKCPRWMKFLDEIMLGDEDTIKTLQQWMGYNLTGSMSLELVAIYFGTGANGKSVFINTMARVAGDYSVAASRSLLVEAPRSNANAPRSDIIATVGKRMAEINETQDRDVLDENTVKGLASPDKISARDLHEKQMQFMPTAKISLRTQHLPIIKGTDEGIWRRLLPIEFKASFVGRENVNLTAELWKESEGILAWAVRGAMDLYAPENLNESGAPESIYTSLAVKRTRDTYRKESDLLGQFLDEYEFTSVRAYDEAGASEKLNMRTDIGQIYMSFKSWCDATGIQIWSQNTLGRRLNERGAGRVRTNGRTYYYLKRKRH